MIIKETIHPSEAYNNYDSVMSVIQGKRNLGQITYATDSNETILNKGLTNNQLVKVINQAGLEAMKISTNPHNSWIIYKPGYEKDAQELNKIAAKYKGYFPPNAEPRDSIRIGQLLGYNEDAINTYIQKNNKLNENISLLCEYITNDTVYLKDYLNMSADQKINSLPSEFSYLFPDFLEEEGINFQMPTHSYTDADGEQPGDPYEIYEISDWLSANNPALYKQFGEWLFNQVNSHTLSVSDHEYPAWSFFDNPTVIKNQWLIHFTNNADAIETQGFKLGVNDMTKLGLTTNLGEFEKEYGGYNFAYLLSDFRKYGNRGYTRGGGFKYGREAVIFRASGIRTYHNSDEEPQVIFYGNTATNIIAIESGENKKYCLKSKITRRMLYESDELQDVVNWLVKHYDQYRKHLS